MERFKRILVAVALQPDGSAATRGSRRAVEQAHRLAELSGGSVQLIHVVTEDQQRRYQAEGAQGMLPDDGLAELHALAGEDYRDEVLIRQGRPWQEVIRQILRCSCDVVIAAKRNKRVYRHYFFGKTAVKLLRKCPCPVWLVDPTDELGHEHIVAATDLTPIGDEVVRLAGDLAAEHRSRLHVVHAYQLPFELQMAAARMPPEEYREARQRLVDEAAAHIEEGLDRDRLAFAPVLHIGQTTPSRAIHDVVERCDADLMVMGTVSRGGIAGFLIGNTAERVLYEVHCSVLTIKPPDFICPVDLE